MDPMRDDATILRQRLAGAALIDEAFRYRLRDDPRAAAESIGIHLSDDDAADIARALRDVEWDAIEALTPLMRAALPRRLVVRELAAWG